ncbi:MAG: hypothetical protein LUD27_01860 [Clostridia bacterium]|nr:hypothetical protein [Clostridia bacterium]
MTDKDFEQLKKIRQEIKVCNRIAEYAKRTEKEDGKITIILDDRIITLYSAYDYAFDFPDKRLRKDIIRFVSDYKKRLETEFNKLIKKVGNIPVEGERQENDD